MKTSPACTGAATLFPFSLARPDHLRALPFQAGAHYGSDDPLESVLELDLGRSSIFLDLSVPFEQAGAAGLSGVASTSAPPAGAITPQISEHRADEREGRRLGPGLARWWRVRAVACSIIISIVSIVSIGCDDSKPRDPGSPPDAGATTDSGIADSGLADAGGADGGISADGGVGADGGTNEELVTCASGSTLLHYSLTPLAQPPSVGQLELNGLPNNTQVVSAGSGESYSVRFDFCRAASGQHSLRGVLWSTESLSAAQYFILDETISTDVEDFVTYRGGSIFRVRLPPAAFVARGIEEAIAGNLQPFELRFVNDFGLYVLGHAGFIAGTTANVGPTTIDYTTIMVIAGGFAEGDVFTARPCPFGEDIINESWRMGTADFAIRACTFLGGGHTAGYRINRLTITDSNSELTLAEQQTMTFDGEPAVEAVLNYRWNHHNACDSFHLALQHADYAATTAPLAGCGEPVPNAPPRDINDDPSGPVEYRIRYHGGAWMDGTIPGCTHYLFCTP